MPLFPRSPVQRPVFLLRTSCPSRRAFLCFLPVRVVTFLPNESPLLPIFYLLLRSVQKLFLLFFSELWLGHFQRFSRPLQTGSYARMLPGLLACSLKDFSLPSTIQSSPLFCALKRALPVAPGILMSQQVRLSRFVAAVSKVPFFSAYAWQFS